MCCFCTYQILAIRNLPLICMKSFIAVVYHCSSIVKVPFKNGTKIMDCIMNLSVWPHVC